MLNLNDIQPSLLADLRRQCEEAAREGREARIDPAAGLLAVALLDKTNRLVVLCDITQVAIERKYAGYFIRKDWACYLFANGEWKHSRDFSSEEWLSKASYPTLLDALCALKRWAEREAEDG